MAKEKGEGFRSGAGLIRYFDAEEKAAFKIDPRVVVALCIATAAIILLISKLWPIKAI